MSRETAIDRAIALTNSAESPEEIEAAHVAMVAAFPKLAAAYPCECESCKAVARRKKDVYR